MTEQHAKKGRLAGAAAGAAVLAAAAAAGFVYWEGTVFDARFADFAKRLSEEGARAGLTIAAEETDRCFAGFTGLLHALSRWMHSIPQLSKLPSGAQFRTSSQTPRRTLSGQ